MKRGREESRAGRLALSLRLLVFARRVWELVPLRQNPQLTGYTYWNGVPLSSVAIVELIGLKLERIPLRVAVTES